MAWCTSTGLPTKSCLSSSMVSVSCLRAVSMRLEKTAIFCEPVGERVPIQTFLKMTKGRKERSAWLLVGGVP